MPTFIKKLFSIVTGGQKERVRAIRVQGRFRMDTTFTHNLVNIDQWGSISDEQKERREARFLKDKGKTHPTIVVSTGGQSRYRHQLVKRRTKQREKEPTEHSLHVLNETCMTSTKTETK